jgi:four helix bundle protein
VGSEQWATDESFMKVRSYRELIVWQKAMDLVMVVYQLTCSFPHEEQYALGSQLRRAAISIPSNIAEGQGRNTTRDFQKYLSIAYGSLQEVETQILIALRLKYINEADSDDAMQQCSEVGRLINGLARSLTPDR